MKANDKRAKVKEITEMMKHENKKEQKKTQKTSSSAE